MRKSVFGWQAVAVFAFACLVLDAGAQSRMRTPQTSRTGTGTSRSNAAGGAGGEDEDGRVQIDRFPSPGKAGLIKTPDFQSNVAGMQSPLGGRKREWGLFEVKYSTNAKWTDELTFTYHVICKGKDEKLKKEIFSYYTVAIRYTDIPKGPHMSCAVLPPSQIERYGNPVAVALEIRGKSDILASKDAQEMNLGREWWKNPKIMDSDNLVRRTGLVDKSKTPFALININDYEVVQ